MPPTFADKVISFNRNLRLEADLPEGIRVMNPFVENPRAQTLSEAFYKKFYDDHRKRRLVLGINPGRFGAGVTGVPFTDTRRLEEKCGLRLEGAATHEPSSVFVYEVIDAYGGAERFYGDYYINSPSPLGYVRRNDNGREVNFNYYDSKALQKAVTPFMVDSIRAHAGLGVHTDVAYCLGAGKNYAFLDRLNQQHHFFDRLVPLEHPRYVMQYRSKEKQRYVDKYLRALLGA